ncbi:hypothetical protein BUALT_Bualt17G0090500 [Buddleja alternifolia]|uniref:KIB1-4 beta-propeller domain-containing protein n=1 Tax=Buddleja alternifolia TaxID=168488 RepID=A0AAV6WHS0_9LAMI|nr:hypothetical protein BUALT_Bualt17G0090500 [Buddleja alternifolia]
MVIENSCCYPPVDSAQTHPWLMVSQGTELQNHCFCNISKHQYFERSIPEFCQKQVALTSYGWLALFDLNTSPVDCCLFNIASQEKIQLPPVELDPKSKGRRHLNCILSKPPNDPDCHVLLLSMADRSIFFCRLGDDKFIKRINRFGDDRIWLATNFKGKIYTWMRHSDLVEIDFVGRELVLKQLVNDKGQPCRMLLPYVTRFSEYLVESCGELLLVYMICDEWSGKVKYFRIFRINILEGEFEELRSIGDRTIFLCNHVSMSSATIDNKLGGLQKNSIYYTWPDKNVYVYDIEYRSKSILEPCPIDDTSVLMSWIML